MKSDERRRGLASTAAPNSLKGVLELAETVAVAASACYTARDMRAMLSARLHPSPSSTAPRRSECALFAPRRAYSAWLDSSDPGRCVEASSLVIRRSRVRSRSSLTPPDSHRSSDLERL